MKILANRFAQVYGALNVTRQGTFAQYCTAAEDEVSTDPK